ncbi:MAG: hypothetical protein JW801_06405 [Bacteroidales bacterium]|nr:hypothetical protein [Bacteroidales bacterium]
MRRIVYIFLLLIVSVPTKLTAQKLDIRDHYKYWYYRQRLNDEFVVIGEANELGVASGLSIPALSAGQKANNQILTLGWLDNPVQGLGRYIGVLATELALLYQYDEPYAQTQWELYCAMKAYERLDYNCEQLFYPDPEGVNLNGLFCRCDVPGNFTSVLHEDFGIDNGYSDAVSSQLTKYTKNCIDSNLSPLGFTFYNSSEEWEGLLTGFALLVKSLANCPEDVVIYNNYRFIDEAILHTQRYMDYWKSNDWIYKLTTGETTTDPYDNKFCLGLYGQARAADFICDPDRQYWVPPLIPRNKIYSTDFENPVNPVTDPQLYIGLASLGFEFVGLEVSSWVGQTLNMIIGNISDHLYDPDNPMDTEPSELNEIKFLLWTALGSAVFNSSFDFNFMVELDNELSDRILDYQKFGWNMFGSPASSMLGQDSIGLRINRYLRDELSLVFPYPYLESLQAGFEYTYDCDPVIPDLCKLDFSGFTLEYEIGTGTLKTERGNIWPTSTAYTLAAIGDSWNHQNGENTTYESLCTYTDPIGWTIFPILNLYLHSKNKNADLVRKKMISQLQTAPCDGPHYLPYFEAYNNSLGTSGWRNNYRWDASIEKINGIMPDSSDWSKGGKFPGLDYMIAYNLLWLEASEKLLFSNYFDMTEHYDNLLDPEINSIETEDEVVYFDFTHNPDAEITLEGSPRTGFYYKQSDVKIITDHVTLTGNQAYGDGYTLEILPDTTVTYCDIEEYLIP